MKLLNKIFLLLYAIPTLFISATSSEKYYTPYDFTKGKLALGSPGGFAYVALPLEFFHDESALSLSLPSGVANTTLTMNAKIGFEVKLWILGFSLTFLDGTISPYHNSIFKFLTNRSKEETKAFIQRDRDSKILQLHRSIREKLQDELKYDFNSFLTNPKKFKIGAGFHIYKSETKVMTVGTNVITEDKIGRHDTFRSIELNPYLELQSTKGSFFKYGFSFKNEDDLSHVNLKFLKENSREVDSYCKYLLDSVETHAFGTENQKHTITVGNKTNSLMVSNTKGELNTSDIVVKLKRGGDRAYKFINFYLKEKTVYKSQPYVGKFPEVPVKLEEVIFFRTELFGNSRFGDTPELAYVPKKFASDLFLFPRDGERPEDENQLVPLSGTVYVKETSHSYNVPLLEAGFGGVVGESYGKATFEIFLRGSRSGLSLDMTIKKPFCFLKGYLEQLRESKSFWTLCEKQCCKLLEFKARLLEKFH